MPYSLTDLEQAIKEDNLPLASRVLNDTESSSLKVNAPKFSLLLNAITQGRFYIAWLFINFRKTDGNPLFDLALMNSDGVSPIDALLDENCKLSPEEKRALLPLLLKTPARTIRDKNHCDELMIKTIFLQDDNLLNQLLQAHAVLRDIYDKPYDINQPLPDSKINLLEWVINLAQTTQAYEPLIASLKKYGAKPTHAEEKEETTTPLDKLIDDHLTCSITGGIFLDPVQVIHTDRDTPHTFERTALVKWQKEHDTCPSCRGIIKEILPASTEFNNLLQDIIKQNGLGSKVYFDAKTLIELLRDNSSQADKFFPYITNERLNTIIAGGEHDGESIALWLCSINLGQKFLLLDHQKRGELSLLAQISVECLNYIVPAGQSKGESVAIWLYRTPKGHELLLLDYQKRGEQSLLAQIHADCLNYIIPEGLYKGESVAFRLFDTPQSREFSLLDYQKRGERSLVAQISAECLNYIIPDGKLKGQSVAFWLLSPLLGQEFLLLDYQKRGELSFFTQIHADCLNHIIPEGGFKGESAALWLCASEKGQELLLLDYQKRGEQSLFAQIHAEHKGKSVAFTLCHTETGKQLLLLDYEKRGKRSFCAKNPEWLKLIKPSHHETKSETKEDDYPIQIARFNLYGIMKQSLQKLSYLPAEVMIDLEEESPDKPSLEADNKLIALIKLAKTQVQTMQAMQKASSRLMKPIAFTVLKIIADTNIAAIENMMQTTEKLQPFTMNINKQKLKEQTQKCLDNLKKASNEAALTKAINQWIPTAIAYQTQNPPPFAALQDSIQGILADVKDNKNIDTDRFISVKNKMVIVGAPTEVVLSLRDIMAVVAGRKAVFVKPDTQVAHPGRPRAR